MNCRRETVKMDGAPGNRRVLDPRDVVNPWGVEPNLTSTESLSYWSKARTPFAYSVVSFSWFWGQDDFTIIFFIISMQPQPQSSSF
jgi:hypothetical protein